MLARLPNLAIRHPVRTLLIAALLVSVPATGIVRLRVRTEGRALIPTRAPVVQFDRAVRDSFDLRDLVVVVVRTRHPAGIYNDTTLHTVANLTRALQLCEWLRDDDIVSLATETSGRVWPGTLRRRRFLEPMPETPEALAALRTDVRKVALYDGTLVSSDDGATAILVGIPSDIDRLEAYSRISSTISTVGSSADSIEVVGAPVAEALLGLHILRDLGFPVEKGLPGVGSGSGPIGMLPLAILLMAVVFSVVFRSPMALLLPVLESLVCVAVVLGTMGWASVPIQLNTIVLPVVLIAIGVADEIHILMRYGHLQQNSVSQDPARLASLTFEEMQRPVLLTSITTAIGFLSFAGSPVAAIRTFGLFGVLGILTCLLFSLTVVPALLVLIHPRLRLPRLLHRSPTRRWNRAGVLRRPLIVGALVLAVSGLMAGIHRLQVQDSWITAFAPASPFRTAADRFNAQFAGAHGLWVHVSASVGSVSTTVDADALTNTGLRLPMPVGIDTESLVGGVVHLGLKTPDQPGSIAWSSHVESVTPSGQDLEVVTSRPDGSPRLRLLQAMPGRIECRIEPRPFLSPVVLRRLDALEHYIASKGNLAVGGVLGPSRYLATTNFLLQGRQESSRRVPDGPEDIRWLWGQYDRIRGVSHRRHLVNADFSTCLVSIYMKDANFRDTQALMDSIRNYERRNLRPHGLKVGFAGDVALSQAMVGTIVSTQVRSLLLSLVGIMGTTMLLFRSFRFGLLAAAPGMLAVGSTFGWMGWTGLPLGVATSMFSAMVLGVGVDAPIHLLARYRRARQPGQPQGAALREALATAGPGILVDGAIVALGFAVLLVSRVPANVQLGELTVIGLVAAVLTTLVLIPTCLAPLDNPDASGREGESRGGAW